MKAFRIGDRVAVQGVFGPIYGSIMEIAPTDSPLYLVRLDSGVSCWRDEDKLVAAAKHSS